jgi:hypothetical protein
VGIDLGKIGAGLFRPSVAYFESEDHSKMIAGKPFCTPCDLHRTNLVVKRKTPGGFPPGVSLDRDQTDWITSYAERGKAR